MQFIRSNPKSNKAAKNLCTLNQRDKTDIDPLVDLEVEGFYIKRVVLDYGSQANIMTRSTWEKKGRPSLVESNIYLKLADQGLIESIGVWKNVKTSIMGINTTIEFKIIDPQEGSKYFHALVGLP